MEEIHVFRVSQDDKIFHMTKKEIEAFQPENLKILSMLGYCTVCQNYSTESAIDRTKIICVLCNNERSLNIKKDSQMGLL